MSTSMTKRLTLGLVALLFVGLGACSSGEGGGEASTGDTSTEASAAPDDGGDGTDNPEDVATEEQCQSIGTVPEDAAAQDETVALFPEALQDDVRQFSEDLVTYVTSVDEETGEPTGSVPEASEALTTFTAGCAELLGAGDGDTGDAGGGDPTFSVTGFGLNGTTATYAIAGTCPDGSFPTDVQLTYGPLGEVAIAEDTGDGSYEFDIEVVAGAPEEQLSQELGIPDGIEGTCG